MLNYRQNMLQDLIPLNKIIIIQLMAFVQESKRQINQVPKTICPLGPGQYFKDDSQFNKTSCAPFQSTSNRKSIFEEGGKTKPGPGDYETSCPFIEPNIKTVSNTQSIIVKINSTGTSPFKSLTNRFDQKVSQEPGPGQYYQYSFGKKNKSRSQSNSMVRQNKITQRLKQLGETSRVNYPAIPEKVRGLTDAKKDSNNEDRTVGPGSYDYDKKKHGNQSSVVWGKDKTRRFSLDHQNQVGPGKYNATYNPIRPQDKIKQPSFAYRSNTVRTYFDSLIYKTNLQQTAEQRKNNKFRSKQPAPGQYDPKVSAIVLKQKPFFQCFGSGVQRFSEDEVTNNPKSKSFYNIKSTIGQNKSFNKMSHSFMCSQTRDPSFLQVKQEAIPGPGHYPENVKVQKKLRGINVQQFGSTKKRPFYQKEQISQLGPGKYTQQERDKEQFITKTKFGQIQQESCFFRSGTGRDCFGINKKQSFPFAQYDVGNHDLSKKLEKQKNFIENLKKIDVDKAPFDSTKYRFPHYQAKKDPQQMTKAEAAKRAEMKIKQDSEKIRTMLIEANKTQITQKNLNGFFNKEQRFKGKRLGAPGVGSYSLNLDWEKKSHNVKYHKK